MNAGDSCPRHSLTTFSGTPATWRDIKLALIVFVREKNLSAIIHKARVALAEHTEFVAFDEQGKETELCCEMRWPGDPDRHATLHVSFFHLPPAG